MVYKIPPTYTNICPYCRNELSNAPLRGDRWGPKYGRCEHCKKIYRTGKKLYSDLPPEEKAADKRKMRITAISAALVMLLAYAICAITAWAMMAVLVFAAFVTLIVTGASYFVKNSRTLKHYDYLKTKDPELYQLEYAESMRIMQKREIHRK